MQIELENFKKSEFACPCCGRDDISKTLVLKLQILRDFVGFPLKISSGVRCKKHNASLPRASPGSKHLKGLAVDIKWNHLNGKQKHDLLTNALALGFGGIGIYKTHLHLDVAGERVWIV